jgi:hypothetical protein
MNQEELDILAELTIQLTRIANSLEKIEKSGLVVKK